MHCDNWDLLVGLEGLHVPDVVAADEYLRVRVESPPGLMGYPTCGVVAPSHGGREVQPIDAPSFGRPVTVMLWKKELEVSRGGVPGPVFTESW